MTDADLPAISHLSLESKRTLFLQIADELLGGKSSISVPAFDREVVISSRRKSPQEIVEEVVRNRTPEQWAELRSLAASPEESCMTLEEVLNLPWEEAPASNPRS